MDIEIWIVKDHNLQLYFVTSQWQPWFRRFNGLFARRWRAVEMAIWERRDFDSDVRPLLRHEGRKDLGNLRFAEWAHGS